MNTKKTIATSVDTSDVLQAVLDSITDNVVVMGQDYRVICFNHLARTTQHLIHDKVLRPGLNYLEFVADENKADFIAAFDKAIIGEVTVQDRLIKIKEEHVWFQVKLNPVYTADEKLLGIAFTATNIHTRKCKEIEMESTGGRLIKVNRELTLLTKVNDLMLTIDDEKVLLDSVCRCIVESGSYRLAWVSYSAEGEMQEVKPVASFGEIGYLNKIRISLLDPEMAKGPTARTLATGIRTVTNNVENASSFRPWLTSAMEYGIAASLVLPLNLSDGRRGTLNIYAQNPDAFDDGEVTILGRLASNLSVAVVAIRTRFEMQRAKHDLNERVKELSAIYNVYRILHGEIHDKGEVLSNIVAVLPAGWQYSDICQARITFDGISHATEGFFPTSWCQRAPILLTDGRSGLIEIVYTEPRPEKDEGPFLIEERNMINTIASTIEVFFNRAAQKRYLLESEARFRAAFEQSAIGMALVSLDGKWLMVNNELCNITGYTKAEMLESYFQEITHPDDLQTDHDALRKLANGEIELYRSEKRFIHKNGAIVWINLNVALLREASGKPMSHVAQIENITEKKESQMKFRDLVEQSLVGVYILQDDKFVYVNPWVLREFGYDEGDVIGSSVFDFILEEDVQRARHNIEARLNMQVDNVQYELRARRKDGSIVWLELFGSKTLYSGKPSIIGTMVDITARKHLEAERRRIIADLVQRNREITDFAEIVSHNLRGPLSTVLGACRMIEEIEDLADLKIISTGLLVNAEKLDSVVRNLNNALSFKSSFTAQVRSVALADVLEEVKRKHEEGVKAVSPDIITDFESGFVINTVTSLFTDLISNIFSNCLLYRSPDRKCRIVISARKTPAEVVISITDNGIGINMKLFGDKLFGLNKRFHNIGNGTGLGLFMSKAMVEVLNGSIGLESEVGVGTTVTIKLPA